jgi:hypothetical protein
MCSSKIWFCFNVIEFINIFSKSPVIIFRNLNINFFFLHIWKHNFLLGLLACLTSSLFRFYIIKKWTNNRWSFSHFFHFFKLPLDLRGQRRPHRSSGDFKKRSDSFLFPDLLISFNFLRLTIRFVGSMSVPHMDRTDLMVIFKSKRMGEGHEDRRMYIKSLLKSWRMREGIEDDV